MKKTYIIPQTGVFDMVGHVPLLQASGDPNTVPVNPGEEGNQEEAEVKRNSSCGVNWDETWE